ncbi:MAG: hypothetical protein V4712_17730 [Pseudomonadota bacterium]
MALIIPEAQTPFSLVEQPRLNPNAPNIGDGVAALADTGLQIVAQKKKAATDRTLREARLTAIEQLDEVRFKYETDTNLDGLTERWSADADAVAGSIAKGLPVHLRADFQTSIREMVAPQTSAIRRREYALFQDREMAALNGDLRRYEKSAATAPDDASRDQVLAEAAAAVGAAVDAGLVSRVEADKILSDIPANSDRIAAYTMLDDDPAGLLEALDSGELSGLTAEEAARSRVAAKGAVATAAARTAREAELQAKTADRELAKKADDAIRIIEDGRPFDGLSDLLGETSGTAHYDRVLSAIDAQQTAGNFALQSPAEQAETLARLEATPTKNPSDVGRVNRLKGVAERTKASLDADRLAHVRERGIMPIDPVDIGDPQSVARRRAEAETVHREFTPEAAEIQYFDKPEAERLAAILASPDTDQAVAVLTAIDRNFGEAAGMAYSQIGATDPVAQLAGALVSDTGQIDTARTLLQGRTMLKAGQGGKLAAEAKRGVVAEFASSFAGPTAAPRLAAAQAAADAYFAASGLGIADPKSEAAKAGYRAAWQAVTGQTTRSGVAYGGTQPVNGRAAVLPPNLSPQQVEQALVFYDEKHWKRASATGHAPTFGDGKAVHQTDRDQRERLNIVSLGSGMYALGYAQRDGTIVYLRDNSQTDGLFRFDLQSLVTGRASQ